MSEEAHASLDVSHGSMINHSSIQSDPNNNVASSPSEGIPINVTGLEGYETGAENVVYMELKKKLIANIEISLDEHLKAFFRDFPRLSTQATQVRSSMHAYINDHFSFH